MNYKKPTKEILFQSLCAIFYKMLVSIPGMKTFYIVLITGRSVKNIFGILILWITEPKKSNEFDNTT